MEEAHDIGRTKFMAASISWLALTNSEPQGIPARYKSCQGNPLVDLYNRQDQNTMYPPLHLERRQPCGLKQ